MNGSNTTFLDCTLRDGGYYNNWRFENQLAVELVAALCESGIDIIEVGFKTPVNPSDSEFDGLFRYCTESQLQFLRNDSRAKYAFMINTKEFISQGEASQTLLDCCIRPAEHSLFDWARIATHFQTVPQSIDQAGMLKNMGYQVAVNLMGISLLSETQVVEVLRQIPPESVDVFYFADSFGNLHAKDVVRYINLIRENYSGKIGIHTHDNQGLAFSNVLTALECGVDFVDSTVTGMGRGAGNLRTEQLLLALNRKVKRLKPAELLDVIDFWFAPLQETYGWGWDYTYMLSAIENIHPIYCQNLRSGDHYSKEQVSCILNQIDHDHRASYNKPNLQRAIDRTINNSALQSEEKLVTLPLYSPVEGDEFLVIASGPSRDRYANELIAFIEQRQPIVIECNPPDDRFKSVSLHYMQSILNWVRLQKTLQHNRSTDTQLVTGLREIPAMYNNTNGITHIPCRIDAAKTEITPDAFTLSAYVVGMFAVGIACLSAPKVVFLAGYDGYPDTVASEQQEMEDFWQVIEQEFSSPLISLTNTNYSIPISSVYGYIQ